MTDKELLKLAAMAAGMVVTEHPRDGLGRVWADGLAWNPLTDDGDALRLAVKLGLGVRNDIYTDTVHVSCFEIDPIEVPYNQDMFAATRRAIVRAAAEIGKGMA